MITGFHALRQKMVHADSVLARAERLGMDSEAGRVSLKQAQDHVLRLRVALHSFDGKQISSVLNAGLEQAAAVEVHGVAAMRDWRVRRIGLAASLGVILVLIALLLLRIRSMGPPS
jgi:hypothetical protein